jgi:hypothetical protein
LFPTDLPIDTHLWISKEEMAAAKSRVGREFLRIAHRWVGGAGRRGGLTTGDFVKCISVQEITVAGFRNLSSDVEALANSEGLLAHARAVEVRK